MLPIAAIDSHHHFWDPDQDHFPWMTERHRRINRQFSPMDLKEELGPANVSGTVLVQIGASYDKNRPFLRAAAETGFVAGVVGWVDLPSANVRDQLDRLMDMRGGEWLVGIRHPVCNEADPNWLLRQDVQRGIGEVARRGLSVDLLVRQRELLAAGQTVDAFPELRFVLDHMAQPDILGGGFKPWADALRRFACGRRNVWCKLSGLVTLADWKNWRPEQIQPYLEEAIAILGPEKCMFGSDWPVCLLAASYGETIDLVRRTVVRLPDDHQEAILRNSAIAAYKLREWQICA